MNETVFGPWRKSSYSADESNCVELAWRKSSYSGDQSDCVELARNGTAGAILDSKNPDSGYLEAPLAGLVALAKSC